MKKHLLAAVMTTLALPAFAVETTTITTSSPEAISTTTTTNQPQEMEEAVAPVTEPSTAPAVDALPQTGAGSLNQQRMEDPADSPSGAYRMDDPSIEDESGEYKLKIDDSENSTDFE